MTTSAAVKLRAASFVGSSQMRMAYFRSPKMMTSPTPGIRFSGVFYIDVEVVGDVLVRQAVIGRIESGGKDEIRIRLCDGDAGVLDFLRQTALRRSHAILHVDSGDIQVVTGRRRR